MATDFLSLGIRPDIVNYLQASGITQPTPIQVQTIPVLLAGRDAIGQSQTGTGKTLAYLLPILEKIQPKKDCIQGLIISPTRELALQISKAAAALAGQLGINVISIYGGQDVERQIRKLKGHPHLVIGTPGRILDHFRRRTITLAGVTKLVIDEADQMLQLGFLEDVEEIIRHTSPRRQVMLLSATMPAKVRSLARRYLDKPADIRVESPHVTLDEIKQIMVEIKESAKLDKLCALIDEYRPFLAIVFCHTKTRASALNESLFQRGYLVDELQGDLSQSKREQVMKRFRNAKLQILVATDIAARGLDITGVTHVFNYDIPHDAESYIHRIGRTGRAGETGIAVTFYLPEEREYLALIEKGIHATLERYTATGQVIVRKPKISPPPKKAGRPAATKKEQHRPGPADDKNAKSAAKGDGSKPGKPRRPAGKSAAADPPRPARTGRIPSRPAAQTAGAKSRPTAAKSAAAKGTGKGSGSQSGQKPVRKK